MGLNRRLFLVTTVGAVVSRPLFAGAQNGLDAFAGDTLPCVLDARATPAVSDDGTYKPGAPMRSSIAASGQKGIPLEVRGTVAGLSCGPIEGAILEFWQADSGGEFDQKGFNLRGRQTTVAGGRYGLTTVVPGGSARRAPSIGVHVIVKGKAELWTVMFFPGPANTQDHRFREDLLVKLTGSAAKRAATFDIRLNL